MGEISKAPAMRVGIAIDNPEGILAARREQKIVTSDIVGDNFQQYIASVGINQVPRRQVDSAGIIERTARRYRFGDVAFGKRQQIGNLLALRIGYRQDIAFVQRERDARTRFNC